MATSDPAEMRVKLRQRDNEFDDVYELLRVVDCKIDALDTKFTGQFEQVGARFEQVDARFEQVDARFEKVDARFEQVVGQLGRLEDGQQEILQILRGPAR